MEAREALIMAAAEFELSAGSVGDRDPRRERLAVAIRSVAHARLRSLVDAALADDLAQGTTRKVLDAFTRGCTTAVRLPAYVEEAARNAFRDHRRRASTKREALTEPANLPVTASDAPTPEEQIANAQTSQVTAARVRTILAMAPATYREALTQHYLDEQPIQDLVEEEISARLIREGRDPGDTLARSLLHIKARQTIDQRLSRGRAWLQQRLTAGHEEGEGT